MTLSQPLGISALEYARARASCAARSEWRARVGARRRQAGEDVRRFSH
jgi:hypothetical protein